MIWWQLSKERFNHMMLLTIALLALVSCQSSEKPRTNAPGEPVAIGSDQADQTTARQMKVAYGRADTKTLISNQKAYQQAQNCQDRDAEHLVVERFAYAYAQTQPRRFALAQGKVNALDDAKVKDESAALQYQRQLILIQDALKQARDHFSSIDDGCVSPTMTSDSIALGVKAGKADAIQLAFQADCVAGYESISKDHARAVERCGEMRRIKLVESLD